MIEAHHLFAMPEERIAVVVHPQSRVHSLVEFVDGTLIAQLAVNDMRFPILYALSYPERLPSPLGFLDLVEVGTLTFEAADEGRFPCLALARAALRAGGSAPAVLNAANEVAVAGFLAGRLSFPGIAAVVAEALDREQRTVAAVCELAAARAADARGRALAAAAIAKYGGALDSSSLPHG